MSVPEESMVPGLVIQRDGVAVSSLIWGTDVPVDPGSHRVTAAAPGREPWSAIAEVKEPGKVVILSVPVLAAMGGASTPSPSGSAAIPPPPEGRSPVPAVLLGVLAASGIGGGAALIAVAGKKGDEAGALRSAIGTNGGADNTCLAAPSPAKCAELDLVTRDQATLKSLAVGSFAAGGLAAAGLLLYVLWPSTGDGPSQASGLGPIRPGFSAGPGGARAFVTGSF
jgi:hypothetical protein